MLKEQAHLVRRLLMLFDLLVLVGAFLLIYALRHTLEASYPSLPGIGPVSRHLWVLLLSLPMTWFLLTLFGAYASLRTLSEKRILIRVGKAFLLGGLILTFLIFLLQKKEVSRSLVLGFWTLSFLGILGEKLLLRAFLRKLRRSGYNFRRIAVVGTSEEAQEFVRKIEKHKGWGFRFLGYVRTDASTDGLAPVLGHLEELPRILDEEGLDEIVFCVQWEELPKVREAVLQCEEVGVKAHVKLAYLSSLLSEGHVEEFYGTPMLTFSPVPHSLVPLLLKRLVDVVVSLVVLVVAAPFMLLIAGLIKICSPGPVLFRQVRCGKNGRRFTLLKFRTMVRDAEEKHAELADLSEASGPVFKMRHDPRVTTIGRFLRRTSLDELPQLLNVLAGQMSLVGPRPPIPEEVDWYQRWQRRRLSMRPGITCLWQIGGRHRVDFEEWMRMDLQYIDNWSLLLDLKILLLTIPAVLSARGAY